MTRLNLACKAGRSIISSLLTWFPCKRPLHPGKLAAIKTALFYILPDFLRHAVTDGPPRPDPFPDLLGGEFNLRMGKEPDPLFPAGQNREPLLFPAPVSTVACVSAVAGPFPHTHPGDGEQLVHPVPAVQIRQVVFPKDQP